jgi:hypothetical protein
VRRIRKDGGPLLLAIFDDTERSISELDTGIGSAGQQCVLLFPHSAAPSATSCVFEATP